MAEWFNAARTSHCVIEEGQLYTEIGLSKSNLTTLISMNIAVLVAEDLGLDTIFS